MKTILPVLFFTLLYASASAKSAPPAAASIDFNAYHDASYDFGYKDSVGCMTKTFYFQDDSFFSGSEYPDSYEWDYGDGTTSTDYYQSVHTYTNPGTYTVTFTIYSNKGKTYKLTKTNYITIGSDFSINLGNDSMICGKNPVVLDATIPGANYLWKNGATTPTITDSLGGTYSVIVDRYGCQAKDTISISRTLISVDLGPDQDICDGSSLTLSGGGITGASILWNTGDNTPDITIWDGGQYYVDVTKSGCKVSDTINVTWKPEITNNFGFQKVSGCLPVDYKFTDSSVVCTGSITGWLWDFGDGTTSTAQNPTHTFTIKKKYTVRLTVTASSGSTLSKAKQVDVNPATVNVDLGLDTTICFGGNVTLDAQNPGATYTWSTGETTQQIVVMDDGAYSVTVDVGGCIAKDTVNVTTSAAATANFGSVTGGNCLPISVNFSDSSIAYCSQSIISWKWNFGDGYTSTQKNPTHVYNTSDSFNVKLTVTTSGGTTSTRTKKVKVINSSFSLDLPADLSVCRGGSVGLDAGVNGAQYAWSPAFGLSASDIRNPVLTPTTDAWYKVAVTKCSVTKSDSVFVKMDSIATPLIVQEGNSLKSPDAVSYQWYYEGKLITGATTKSIRVDKAGYYSLSITNSNGCINQSQQYFYVPVSGNEKIDSFRMKLSPNPARGAFNILFSQIPAKAAKVSLYDAAGKRLFITTVQDHVNRIDANKLLKGLYFVEIIMDNERTIMPLVIQ